MEQSAIEVAQEKQSPPETPRFRLLAPAITPIQPSDLRAGLVGHIRDTGRDEFREAIRQYLDGDSAATYPSYRRALIACLDTLHTQSENKSTVAIPAFCSSDYHTAITSLGLDVARYDVNPTSLAADLRSLTELNTDDLIAIVVVNVLGYGSVMDDIVSYCNDQDVYLVESLGYAFGAMYNGRRLGTFGDCSLLNFQQGKPLPIGGGMVVSRNQTVTVDDARPPVSPNLASLAGYTLFSRPRPYYLYRTVLRRLLHTLRDSDATNTHPESKTIERADRQPKTLSNFQGAIGLSLFDRHPEIRFERANTAAYYEREFEGLSELSHLTPESGLSNHQYVRYPILIDQPQLRHGIHAALLNAGIETTMLYDWPPIDADRFPGAAYLQNSILTLPTHPFVTEADRRRCVHHVEKVCQAARRYR